MPFFKPANKFVLGCDSLQVQKPKYEKNNNIIKKGKRVCLFTSLGSITIEATIAITMFMIVILYVMSFMNLIGSEFKKQMFIDSVSKKMSKAVFYVEVADKLTDYDEELKNEKEKIKQLAEDSKKWGLNVEETIFNQGNIDIQLVYPLELPYWRHFIFVKQRSRIKDWTGTDISKSQDIVYITKTVTVYHRSKECSHLVIHINSDTYGNLSNLRNKNGGKYTRCENCASRNLHSSSTIFITTDGNRYHTDLQCPGLSRYLIEIDLSQIGERKPCSECGG